MKGQAALDYMIISAFSLVLIIPVFYYAVVYSSDSITVAQTTDAVNTLAKAADNTYSLGEGSLSKIQVNVPNGVQSVAISSNIVSMRVATTSGISDVVSVTKAPVNGSIPTKQGTYSVVLNNTGPFVSIGVG